MEQIGHRLGVILGRSLIPVLHPVSHSNTFLSRFFNLTTFNIGYHIEHHDYPAVHWSELPAFHEQLNERLIKDGAHILPLVTTAPVGTANALCT